MKATIGISILLAIIVLSQIGHAQVLTTDAETNQLVIPNAPPAEHDQFFPVIQLADVPITEAIENLARQAGINYTLDPKLTRITGSEKDGIPEPLVNCKLKNVTARDTLQRMLALRRVAMIEGPFSHVVRLTAAGQATNVVDASLLGMETNSPATTNDMVRPSIQFQDVVLVGALESLIKIIGGKIQLDSQLSLDPSYGDIVISIRWQNITAKQALIALCENYDLILVKDAATGAVQIIPRPAAVGK